MHVLGQVVLAGLSVAFAIGFISGWRRAVEERRRTSTRAANVRRKHDAERVQIVSDIARYFPHAREALLAEPDRGGDPEEAVRRALISVPGVLLGEASVTLAGKRVHLPAVWPTKERRKPGYVTGRTGSGKSTALVRAIKADIDAGMGLLVIAPERELFVETLLPLCEKRANETIYWSPGALGCPIGLNSLATEPGDDVARCAAEVFTILERIIGGDGLGARMSPILGNSLAALVERPGMTLLDIKRLLEDTHFRSKIVAGISDPYVKDYWISVFARYPKDAHVSTLNRLDELFRSPHLRNALCCPAGISIRDALSKGRIVLVDLGGLDPQSVLLIGQIVIAKVGLELLRRETIPQAERSTFALYCDEFQTFSSVSEGSWRELLSRGRRYGLAMTLANQFPSQLPTAVRDEILGNVASVIAFSLGSKDAEVMKKELLYSPGDGEPIRPVPVAALVHQSVGNAVAKFGSAALAFRLEVAPPVKTPSIEVGDKVREISWATFGAKFIDPVIDPANGASSVMTDVAPEPRAPSRLSETEIRFLTAVAENPGRPSGEYGKLLGLNGSRGARVRARLVEQGFVREHLLARAARGKPAKILQPLPDAQRLLTAAEEPRS